MHTTLLPKKSIVGDSPAVPAPIKQRLDAASERTLTSSGAPGQLRSEVLASLCGSGYAALQGITCDVTADRVILRGSTPSYHLKQLAQVFAQRVDGVARIENRVVVRSRAAV